MKKIKVGVLGATGMVGQRFIELLHNHPWFELSELGASERSAGKSYGEAVEGRWKQDNPIPKGIADLEVKDCKPGLDCKIVFGAMDRSIAGPIEEEFALAGYAVVTNSKNHRMIGDVPLLIPEVNAGHLEILKKQKERFGDGLIVTNPNCSTIGMVLALAPLHKQFGISKIMVTTMQAVSGAGYPGVPSLDVLDNVIPNIGGEEEKMETESLKILGTLENNQFKNAEIKISADCNRVAVKDGHLESISIELKEKATKEQLVESFKNFNPLKGLNLPTAPDPPIVLREEEDRPQPRQDRNEGKGMAAVIGRIRECNVLDWKLNALSHNTIRGAAGASILNAELLAVKGHLK
ncbi:MAG: aspartate-semialdehyde dehydrogenase [Candidatus Diapherotrites archaeon]